MKCVFFFAVLFRVTMWYSFCRLVEDAEVVVVCCGPNDGERIVFLLDMNTKKDYESEKEKKGG